jgi:hypothetical protein
VKVLLRKRFVRRTKTGLRRFDGALAMNQAPAQILVVILPKRDTITMFPQTIGRGKRRDWGATEE